MTQVTLRNLLFTKKVGPREGLSRECQLRNLTKLKFRKRKSRGKIAKMKVVFISLVARIQTTLVPVQRAVHTVSKVLKKLCRILTLVTIQMC